MTSQRERGGGGKGRLHLLGMTNGVTGLVSSDACSVCGRRGLGEREGEREGERGRGRGKGREREGCGGGGGRRRGRRKGGRVGGGEGGYGDYSTLHIFQKTPAHAPLSHTM